MNVTVHGTDDAPGSGVASVDWKIDGVPGSAVGDTGTAVVTGTGEHVVETRVIDVAGNVSAVGLAHRPPGPDVSAQHVADRFDGLARELVLGRAQRRGRQLRRRLRALARGQRRRARRHARHRDRDGLRRRHPHARDPRPRRRRQLLRLAPRDDQHRLREAGQHDHRPRARRSAAATRSPSPAPTRCRASRACEWQIDAGPVEDHAAGDDPRRRPAHPEVARAGQRRQLERLARPERSPSTGYLRGQRRADRHDHHPDRLAHRRGHRHRLRRRSGRHGRRATSSGASTGSRSTAATNGATFAVTDDGVHDIETRATDNAGNTSAWRSQTLKVDHTLPVDTTAISTGWTKVGSLHAERDRRDLRRGRDRVPHQQRLRRAGRARAPRVPLADGTYTIGHRVYDVAGQLTGWKTRHGQGRHVDPGQHVRRRADRVADERALARPDRHRHGLGRRSRRVADRHHRRPDLRHARRGRRRRHARRCRPASSTRPATRPPGARRPSRSTAPSRPTRPPRSRRAGARRTSRPPSPAPTRRRAWPTVEWRLDGGAITSTPAVSISADGMHKLETRVTDVAGNVGDWRIDNIGDRQGRPDAGRQLRQRHGLAQHAGRLHRDRRRRRLRRDLADRRHAAPTATGDRRRALRRQRRRRLDR